jgi:hypothetical protein
MNERQNINRIDEYRHRLFFMEQWTDYLLARSRLLGPRANLEMARAVAL